MPIANRVVAARKAPAVIQGQFLYTGQSNTTFTVPAGVTSISILCIQEGQARGSSGAQQPCSVLRFDFATVICRAQNGNRLGTGGGDGGTGASVGSYTQGPGGGGAGGYAGNGGAGGVGSSAGGTGTGGGAGGGGGRNGSTGTTNWGGGGAGTGVLGQGANGPGGTGGSGAGGGGGSGGQDGATNAEYINALYGGGAPGLSWSNFSMLDKGGNGGALSYANNVAVTPGEQLLIRIYGTDGQPAGVGNAAVRIIWGPGRAFPSTNTGNV